MRSLRSWIAFKITVWFSKGFSRQSPTTFLEDCSNGTVIEPEKFKERFTHLASSLSALNTKSQSLLKTLNNETIDEQTRMVNCFHAFQKCIKKELKSYFFKNAHQICGSSEFIFCLISLHCGIS